MNAPNADARERRILALAREYIGIDGDVIGSTPGELVWRSGDAGAVRRHFLEAVGRGDLPDLRPPRVPVRVEWRMGSARMHVSGEVRTRGELAMALGAFGVDPATLPLGQGLRIERAGETLPDLGSVMLERWPARRREREPRTVARTLTLYYLSRAGGGTRSLEAAGGLWEKQGGTLPLGWESAHYRALRWVRETLGDV